MNNFNTSNGQDDHLINYEFRPKKLLAPLTSRHSIFARSASVRNHSSVSAHVEFFLIEPAKDPIAKEGACAT